MRRGILPTGRGKKVGNKYVLCFARGKEWPERLPLFGTLINLSIFFALTTPALSLASPSLEWRKGVTAASFSPPSTFEKINLWNLCPSQSLLLLLPPPLQLASWKEKKGESRPPPFLPRPAPHPKHPKEKEEEDAKGERGSLSFFGEGGRREAGQWDKRGRREGGESLCVVVKKYPFSLFRSLVNGG